MGLLDNRVILIVGGTSGIGEAVAIEAALNGAKVVVAGRREGHGNKVIQAIKERSVLMIRFSLTLF
jgi:NAD(P)-dependent dehydrogenase (short-subunit alcohol dehydrogenase family)